MSETRIPIEPEMPQGYEKFSGIEVLQKEDGTKKYNGIIEYGVGDKKTAHRLPLNMDISEMWGLDPNEDVSAKGLWRSDDEVKEVTIVDVVRRDDNEVYYKAVDIDEEIPGSQLEWTDAKPDTTTDLENSPEVAELRRMVLSLQTQLKEERQQHAQSLTAVDEKLDTITQSLADLQEKIETGNSTGTAPTIVSDPRYQAKETRFTAFKRKITGAPEPPEYYYVDSNQRRYMLEEDGTRVYVDEKRGSGGKILAIGATALALIGIGYIAHEAEEIEHRQSQPVLTSPDNEDSIEQLRADRYANRLAEDANRLALQDRNQDKQILRAQRYGNRMLEQIKKVEVQTRNGVRYNQYLLKVSNAQDKAEGQSISYNGEAGGYSYPWGWSADEYGKNHAETQLHVLGKKAEANGHKVIWSQGGYSNGRKVEILSIDGKTNTAYVVNVLNRYK